MPGDNIPADLNLDKSTRQACLVPLKVATEENTRHFGRFVTDFKKEEVWLSPWPRPDWRPIRRGTEIFTEIETREVRNKWEGEKWRSITKNRDEAFLPPGVATEDRGHVLSRMANYHPSGGQVFYPAWGNSFVLVLAQPGDNVKPEDFLAFYFDGKSGFQVNVNVWHQAIFSEEDETFFLTKHSKVHPCIEVDILQEFGRYLKVPLNPRMASE